MQAARAVTIPAHTNTSAIRWGRVLAGGVLSELGVFAAIFAAIGVYTVVFAPATSEEALRPEYYTAPAAALVATFLCAWWAARKAGSRFIAHGTLVGVAAVLLSVGFIAAAEPEDRLMYMVSFALRIVGGYAGGIVAARRQRSRAS